MTFARLTYEQLASAVTRTNDALSTPDWNEPDRTDDSTALAKPLALLLSRTHTHGGRTMVSLIKDGFPLTARRVTMHEARRAFDAGREILVSEYGDEPKHAVTRENMTHSKTSTTFEALRAQVNDWRGRYPNQRYYIVSL
jgi:hypothetical protein